VLSRGADIRGSLGEIPPLEIQSDVHEPYEHGNLDKRTYDGGESSSRVYPEHRDDHRDGKLEIIARRGERECGSLRIIRPGPLSAPVCLAPIFRTRERMMGIGHAITMPLFFASNAIYPISLMPGWLKTIATINPLSYVVDALRALLVTGDFSNIFVDLFAITLATVVPVVLASFSFRRIVS
jgi:hypothetical protein